MLDAFDERTNGLSGMAEVFASAGPNKTANAAGAELALQMQRFVASDVIWEDLFREPTVSELDNLGITGVNVPGSQFLRNPDIATTASMRSVWMRIHGAATGGDDCEPRGTGIVSTTVQPGGTELSTAETNTIELSTDLTFTVTVENSGCAQEVGLKVRLTIQQSPRPITAQRTIDLIDSGDEQTVTFTDLGSPDLDQSTSLTVEVDPVPGESNTDNNTENYPVQFSVG
jgi:CARDB